MKDVLEKIETEEVTKIDIKSLVEKQVMETLGKPNNFDYIRSKNVYNNRWRVDVWCEHESNKTMVFTKYSTIDYSYFIKVDDEGKIVESSPKIGGL